MDDRLVRKLAHQSIRLELIPRPTTGQADQVAINSRPATPDDAARSIDDINDVICSELPINFLDSNA